MRETNHNDDSMNKAASQHKMEEMSRGNRDKRDRKGLRMAKPRSSNRTKQSKRERRKKKQTTRKNREKKSKKQPQKQNIKVKNRRPTCQAVWGTQVLVVRSLVEQLHSVHQSTQVSEFSMLRSSTEVLEDNTEQKERSRHREFVAFYEIMQEVSFPSQNRIVNHFLPKNDKFSQSKKD